MALSGHRIASVVRANPIPERQLVPTLDERRAAGILLLVFFSTVPVALPFASLRMSGRPQNVECHRRGASLRYRQQSRQSHMKALLGHGCRCKSARRDPACNHHRTWWLTEGAVQTAIGVVVCLTPGSGRAGCPTGSSAHWSRSKARLAISVTRLGRNGIAPTNNLQYLQFVGVKSWMPRSFACFSCSSRSGLR
jgi:hypothetical protein